MHLPAGTLQHHPHAQEKLGVRFQQYIHHIDGVAYSQVTSCVPRTQVSTKANYRLDHPHHARNNSHREKRHAIMLVAHSRVQIKRWAVFIPWQRGQVQGHFLPAAARGVTFCALGVHANSSSGTWFTGTPFSSHKYLTAAKFPTATAATEGRPGTDVHSQSWVGMMPRVVPSTPPPRAPSPKRAAR